MAGLTETLKLLMKSELSLQCKAFDSKLKLNRTLQTRSTDHAMSLRSTKYSLLFVYCTVSFEPEI
jgi:hypothetical protein